MIWIRSASWIIRASFVLLAFNAFGLWSVNRPLAITNLVLDGLILVYSVVVGYRNPSKE